MNLDGALGWIGDLVAWIARFIPKCVIVDSTKGAIKWVNPITFPHLSLEQEGWRPVFCLTWADSVQRVVQVGPGRHWYWPWTTQFEMHPTARQTRELPVQLVTLSDGVSIGVRAVVRCEVSDLKALVADTEDPVDTVRDEAGAAINDVMAELTHQEFLERGFHRKLKGAVEAALRPYGVNVVRVKLLECAPARMYRVVQNPNTDGV